MKRAMLVAAAVMIAGMGMRAGMLRGAEQPDGAASGKQSALDFEMKDIDGKEVDLRQYAGKVVMIVNVASKCGNTPQYAGLEAMYKKYKDRGFVILGFPENDFKSQEPGTNAQIKQFCTSKYGVTFPMFSKIDVIGKNEAPLYKYLTAQETSPVGKGEISWNFEKFVIGRDGNVVARFAPKTKPERPEVVAAVEKALGK